jgi:hypothetical protein
LGLSFSIRWLWKWYLQYNKAKANGRFYLKLNTFANSNILS